MGVPILVYFALDDPVMQNEVTDDIPPEFDFLSILGFSIQVA